MLVSDDVVIDDIVIVTPSVTKNDPVTGNAEGNCPVNSALTDNEEKEVPDAQPT